MGHTQKLHNISTVGEYIPRGLTVLHTILDKHFSDFVDNYKNEYAEECGKYSLERITSVVEEYLKCGDFKHGWSETYGFLLAHAALGIARVKCTNSRM